MHRKLLLAAMLALAFGASLAVAGDNGDVLYAFETGNDGWWSYAGGATAVLTHDKTTGADGSSGSLKAVYKYAKAGGYLGLGVETEYALGKGKWAPYADGFLSLSLKSDVRCALQLELRAKDGKTFSTTLPPGGSDWARYSIPFSEFKAGNESLDLKSTEIQKIVLIPAPSDANEHRLWLDTLGVCKDGLKLPSMPAAFNFTGKVVDAAGVPLGAANVFFIGADGLSPLEQTVTGADGSFALSRKIAARRFLVIPPDAIPETQNLAVTLVAQKEGFISAISGLTLKLGDNDKSLVLAALKPVDELHVDANQLKTAGGKVVVLQGVCIDSLEWSATGENILQSVAFAIDQWSANVIRLPINDDFWFGHSAQQHDGGTHYRELIDAAVEAAGARGAHLALDLHRFGVPTEACRVFWKDAAEHFKNNPVVLFELMNEPHSVTWEIWRNGGELGAQKNKDVNAAENKEKTTAQVAVGMQNMLDAVRATGARNICIAGGLDWGYDLSGVVDGFALKDVAGGNGVIYSSHVYPWKSDWQNKFLKAAEIFPLFIGEVGCTPAPMPWQNGKTEDPKTWAPDMLGVMQKHALNWTAFSFHPNCAPNAILDWTYTPTPYWGTFVKEVLNGKVYEVQRLR